jgi:hypothetical protein
VLADAVDALGYDTLVRDACRTLQARKAKDGDLCQPIIASSLRLRCGSQLAVTSARRVVMDEASPSMGSPVRLTLTTKVADAARVFRLEIELVSFVRDGVALPPEWQEQAALRTLSRANLRAEVLVSFDR